MPTFATDILDAMASTTQAFVTDFVASYWPLILSIGVILAIGGLLLRVGRFGRRG